MKHQDVQIISVIGFPFRFVRFYKILLYTFYQISDPPLCKTERE